MTTNNDAMKALNEMPKWEKVSPHMSAPTANFSDWAIAHEETIRTALKKSVTAQVAINPLTLSKAIHHAKWTLEQLEQDQGHNKHHANIEMLETLIEAATVRSKKVDGLVEALKTLASYPIDSNANKQAIEMQSLARKALHQFSATEI